MLNNKSVLITGGTGSFGKKFIELVLKKANPKRVPKGGKYKQKTYFRDWEYIPHDHYDMMKEAQTGAMQDPNVREWKYNPEGYYLSFVIHGQSAINQKRITERWKGDGYENVYITWLYGTDRVRKIKDVMENIDGEPADLGWCSGATAMYIACKEEQPKTPKKKD